MIQTGFILIYKIAMLSIVAIF